MTDRAAGLGGSGRRVAVIEGDGVGPELIAAAREVVDAAGASIEWVKVAAGRRALEERGTPLPGETVDAIREIGCALKGPLETRPGDSHRSPNLALKSELGLYVQVRPTRSWQGVPAPFGPIDIVVIREITEDTYAGIEFDPCEPDTHLLIEWLRARQRSGLATEAGITIKAISEQASRRVAEFAFDYARRSGRERVTAVHKATVMRSTDGVFLRAAEAIAAHHAEIQFDDVLIDRLAMDLVRTPGRFDLLLLPNAYGDIISDLVAGLAGGTGLAPGASFGDATAVFEAAHGTVRSRVGRGTANPIAVILSSSMLLRHLGETDAADRIDAAVGAVLRSGRALTSDLRRSSATTTRQVTADLVAAIDRGTAEPSEGS